MVTVRSPLAAPGALSDQVMDLVLPPVHTDCPSGPVISSVPRVSQPCCVCRLWGKELDKGCVLGDRKYLLLGPHSGTAPLGPPPPSDHQSPGTPPAALFEGRHHSPQTGCEAGLLPPAFLREEAYSLPMKPAREPCMHKGPFRKNNHVKKSEKLYPTLGEDLIL